MLATTYTALFVLAAFWLALLLRGDLPSSIGAALSIAWWLALVPASYAVEIGAETGSVTVVQQPTMAFVAIAGAGVSGLYLFADVTGRISGSAQEVRNRA